jgi:hypothetical protein
MKNQIIAQNNCNIKAIKSRCIKFEGKNENLDSSTGVARRRTILNMNNTKIVMVIKLVHSSNRAFFLRNISPFSELLDSSKLFKEFTAWVEK